MLQTFVDDCKNIVKELPVGAEIDITNKKITINKDKIETDKNIPGDKRTFEIIKK